MRKTLMLVLSLALIAALIACAPKIRIKNNTSETFDTTEMSGYQYTINGSDDFIAEMGSSLAPGATTKYLKCEKGDAVLTVSFSGASMSMNLTNASGEPYELKNFKKYTFSFDDSDIGYSIGSPVSGYVTEDAEAGF